ncbi:LapA family protein [Rhodobacteraceae bacterium]|nr:LapA family protein [Paracoccaceae bacterium]
MRLIRLFILGIIAIALIIVAIANREPLTFRLLPDELSRLVGFNWDITLPTFAILFVAAIVGVALGYLLEWVREHKHRATAVTETKARQRLEQKVKEVAPSEEQGDDVLALLDAR